MAQSVVTKKMVPGQAEFVEMCAQHEESRAHRPGWVIFFLANNLTPERAMHSTGAFKNVGLPLQNSYKGIFRGFSGLHGNMTPVHIRGSP